MHASQKPYEASAVIWSVAWKSEGPLINTVNLSNELGGSPCTPGGN